MKPFIRAAVLALVLFISTSSSASSRSGYRLLFADLSTSKDAAVSTSLMNYLNSKLSPDTYRCVEANRLIEIDLVYVKKRPKAITNDKIAKSLYTEEYSLNKLRKALRTYRDSEIDKGFDGLVVFNNDGVHYELTTIGLADNGYKESTKIKIKNGMDTRTLSILFCRSLANLPYSYID